MQEAGGEEDTSSDAHQEGQPLSASLDGAETLHKPDRQDTEKEGAEEEQQGSHDLCRLNLHGSMFRLYLEVEACLG